MKTVESNLNADLYLYSGDITDNGHGALMLKLEKTEKKRDNALLILSTNGGDPHAAYRIATMFYDFYEEFEIYAPSFCKSAGTLIVIGAKRLYMGSQTESGPLDTQFKDNPFSFKSRLKSIAAFEGL